jgi:hypothetical protein
MKVVYANQSKPLVCKILLSALLLACLLLLQACASPTGKLTQYAERQGFARSWIKTSDYKLMVFDNTAVVQPAKDRRRSFGKKSELTQKLQSPDKSRSSGVLHIYLEGDGSPWRHRTIIMPDPTPRSPLMLKLMAIDPHLSAYLGRPCYNGTSNDPGCDHSLWTSGRYSKAVVQSMAAAIRSLAKRLQVSELWLLGHSGGGTLAMLLAAEVQAVTKVVTIAGNLDTDAWTDFHNYTKLYSSANPAKLPALRETVTQWHLLGGRDRVIPTALVRDAIARQKTAQTFMLPGYSHGCCWSQVWPTVLEALYADDPSKVPGHVVKPTDISTFVADDQ